MSFNITEVIKFFNNNSGISIVIITFVYCVVTYLIFRENKKANDLLKEQNNIQKNNWLKEEIYCYEIKVLLEFYKKFMSAEKVLFWFTHDLANPFKEPTNEKNHNNLTYQNGGANAKFLDYWNEINSLNAYVNSNMIIFQKYNIAKYIQYFWCLLSMPMPNNLNEIQRNNLIFVEFDNISKIRLALAKEMDRILTKSKNWKKYSVEDENKLLEEYGYYLSNFEKGINEFKEKIEEILFQIKHKDIPIDQQIGIHIFSYPRN
ncbi:MAG: hypothetical protein IKN62_07990 [Elusimicrobia bacterium]|nr:hypothetical protein [Elusimicrobiota bacterium]